MIKLITPKRDLYMDGDTSNPEGLFGKKGKFYEMEERQYCDYIMFIDERGAEHSYVLDFIDNDFWTVDFDKGFEFSRYGGAYEFKGGRVTHREYAVDDVPVSRAIDLITEGLWPITRFSNQTLTHVSPEEISNPYENWKKDIGIAKFQRCIEKSGARYCIVEGINGYLDAENNLFYYPKYYKGKYTYLRCKVDRDYDVNFYRVLQFIRDNKDVGLVGQVDLESYSATVRKQCVEMDNILASFKLPQVGNSESSPSSWEEVISEYNKEQRAKEDEHKVSEEDTNTWTDKHYDFTYTLTPEDITAGEIKIDPYFVSYQWKLGEKDNSGALWHCFKGIARFGEKNTVEREIKALHAQIKRLAEIRGVKL